MIAWLLTGAELGLSVLGLKFATDPLSLTLLPATAVSFVAMILVTPEDEAKAADFGRLLLLLALACLAEVAGDARTLLACESLVIVLLWRWLRGLRGRTIDSIGMVAAFAALLFVWARMEQAGVADAPWPVASELLSTAPAVIVAVVFAVFQRLGLVPVFGWVGRAFDRDRVAAVLPAALPFTGLTIFARAFESPGLVGVATMLTPVLLGLALVFAILALRQQRLGRSFAFMLLAAESLACVGLIDPDPVGHIGGAVMWASILVASTAFGLAVVAVLSRSPGVNLHVFRGLHFEAPHLGFVFLLSSMALSGVPGTIDFAADDLVLHGSLGSSAGELLTVCLVISIVGFNAIRLSFRLFFGEDAQSNCSPGSDLVARERMAFLGLLSLLAIGGFAPTLLPLLGTSGH